MISHKSNWNRNKTFLEFTPNKKYQKMLGIQQTVLIYLDSHHMQVSTQIEAATDSEHFCLLKSLPKFTWCYI